MYNIKSKDYNKEGDQSRPWNVTQTPHMQHKSRPECPVHTYRFQGSCGESHTHIHTDHDRLVLDAK